MAAGEDTESVAADFVDDDVGGATAEVATHAPWLVAFVFFVLLGLRYAMWAVRLSLGAGGTDSEEVRALKGEIAEIKQEILGMNVVSQFVAHSKATRQLIKKEKALAELAEAPPAASSPLRSLLGMAGGTVGEVVFSTVLVWYFWDTTLLLLPPNWLMPFGLWSRLWHGESEGFQLGIVLWTAICGRISGRLFKALHPTAKPGFDIVAMRKHFIGF